MTKTQDIHDSVELELSYDPLIDVLGYYGEEPKRGEWR